ncbi:unnamed protein product (macronuclear) [Paramecium tetraurelia]|uniref:EGF-like domain-containing protein n=1 Tax=Paramecium tetraurelia TaxID=5888 RepID=A0CUF8_PARTE|nr:uncharacterized protein GSPATT00010625001 [Paramecium tetraurelia]CAK74425.1 unnamed protein product [Paramecium tetraurelia]|eukprot:XP_001441822.1 hypothetical protein (macronuclear) [Paramecium tetraurelia strain d4-2]
MLITFFDLMLFIFLPKPVENLCLFSSLIPLLSKNNNQFSIDQELSQEFIQGQANKGFGVWMNYQPMTQISELSNRATQNFSILKDQIIIQGQQFIYSIERANDKVNWLVVSADIDPNKQIITHKVFYSFKTLTNTLSFEFDNILYEGQWIMFYCYFDNILRQSLIGFYNAKEDISIQIVNDLPQYVQTIKHNVGNTYSYTNQEGSFILLSQFMGRLTSIFSAEQDNVFLDIDTCSEDFFGYLSCYERQYLKMNGTHYIKTFTQEFSYTPRYVFQGWVMIAESSQVLQETTIFRITLNQDYGDDLTIGDRDLLLKYYQSSIPSENGFEISTYSYEFPVKERHQTNEDDRIRQFGDEYTELLIKWHYFFYEFGSKNNKEQPYFSIFFPSINQVRSFTWSKTIRHFSGTNFQIFLGGDYYAQNYLRGYVSDVQFLLLCSPKINEYKPPCHYSCLECEGPTKYNCLSCSDQSFRHLTKNEKTCACQQRYIDIEGVQDCQSVTQAFPQIYIQEVELFCQQSGYSICNQNEIECNFGYFEYQGMCVQCPYFYEVYAGKQIICLDCLVSPKQFGQTLTCKMKAETYELQEDYLYQVQKSDQNDYLYFYMLTNVNGTYDLKLCQGCISKERCRNGFYLENSECKPCLNGCMECLNSFECKNCFSNYYLSEEKICLKCGDCLTCKSNNNGSYQCIGCLENQQIIRNQCIFCGDYCQECDASRLCNFCKDSPLKYYLSMDGQNCRQCNIENCIYCFDYILNGRLLQTSLDINFKVINFNFRQLHIGCALCKENYHYNFNSQKCELKEIDDDCEFAIIEIENQKKTCIISKTNQYAVQVSNCIMIPNCISCIHNYIDNESFCIVCQDGYYSAILKGQCIQCGQSCKTCIQQNVKYRDYWKWSIKAFYKYFINLNNDHPFENYASLNSESDMKLICTSCHYGYILYNQLCIKNCDQTCNKCEIINGKATCIQCLETIAGFMKSQNENGGCLQCPPNCIACVERSESEIQQVNPYFILTDSNKFQTRKCYEKAKVGNTPEKYYQDSLSQTIVVCNKYEQCYNKIIFRQIIHCDDTTYYDEYFQTNDEYFESKNVILYTFFDIGYLEKLETTQLFDYLNDISARHISFEYTLFQFEDRPCEFLNNLKIFSTLAQQVFSVQQIDIKFKGKQQTSDDPIDLLIPSTIFFNNFTTISFENINFQFTNNEDSITGSSILSLSNFKSKMNLNLKDCKFESRGPTISGQGFKVESNIPYSIFIKNLVISNIKIQQSDIFTFISQTNLSKNQIQISNMAIINSIFIDTTFFKFLANTNHLQYQSELRNISIIDSIFERANFFICSGLLDYTIGTLNIQQIFLHNVDFLNSNIFILPIVESVFVSQLILQNSKLKDNSSLFSSNVINLEGCIINQTLIELSSLIHNKVNYTKSQIALNQSSKIVIKNLQVLNINYNNKQQIIKIVKYDEIDQLLLNLTNLTIKNCISNPNFQNTQVSFDQVMIYIECQYCYLYDVQIQRGYGHPEMTIFNSKTLEIRNWQFFQDQRYFSKALHSSIECVSQFAIMELYFFLYVGQYQRLFIDNLNVSTCLSFNTPLIILKGYDIMQKMVEETIVVQNSQFSSNLLIISTTNKNSALISLESQQKVLVTFINTKFSNNHLNTYYQTLSSISSSTILLFIKYGNVFIQDCQFYQNLVTNSTDSIIYIVSKKVYIKDSTFKNNNIMNYSIMSRYMIISIIQVKSTIDLQLIFPIKSNSGNGMIISNSIEIQNIKVNASFSIYGGGFYIITSGTSIINITNSEFSNTKTTLSSLYFSKGGCLYIDAVSSALTLQIKNVTFDKSFSRYDGGAIYINPSETLNIIELEKLIVKDCFSIQNSFFSYVLTKKDTVQSYIVFKDIEFYSTKVGLENYYSYLDGINDEDAVNIIQQNPLIYVEFGNFSIKNCQFISIYTQFLLKIVQAQNILMSNIKITNCTVGFSPLIQFNFRQQYAGELKIFDLQINQLYQFLKTEKRECLIIKTAFPIQLDCPLKLTQYIAQLNENINDQYNLNQLICNQAQIFKNPSLKFSLIEIEQINVRNKVTIQKMDITNVECINCYFGLIRIVEIEQQDFENIKISKILIKNSHCGRTGCLSIAKNKNDLIIQDPQPNYRILQQHNYENLLNSMKYQLMIKQSQFLNNSATYGGSILIMSISTIIKDCIFQNNLADLGGAIYYSSEKEELYILDTKIIENKAEIAGGIYLSSQSLQQTKQLDLLLDFNNSTLFGSSALEKPRSLTLAIQKRLILQKKEIIKTDKQIVEQILIDPYKILGSSSKQYQLMLPSGTAITNYRYFDPVNSEFIPYNLTLRIIALDKFQEQIKGLSGSNCILQPIAFNLRSQQEQQNVQYNLSQYEVIFNDTTGDYNLDNLIIYFNPTYDQDIVLRLSIQCNSVLVPQYKEIPPYEIYNYVKDYKLFVDIRTFHCQLGEFLNQTSGGCVLCDTFQNQYQVSLAAQNCSYKDNSKIKSLESSMIELREHYWRPYYYSQTIENCYHLDKNCQGGWKPGDKSCIQGHIGALCEQCDLYNSRGSGSYSVSSTYSCGSCDQIAYNIITIIFVSLWTFISTFISVNSTIQMLEEFIQGLILKSFGVRLAIKEAQTAILIKVFTNYLQIISTISTFQLQIPTGLASVVNTVGNPIESLAYSLDCFLVTITDILIIYFRIIWSLIMTSTYIAIIFSLYGILIITKKITFNISYISTSLIYLFIFFQPNLIGGIISILSYRIISDEYWIQGNVSYRYDTISHFKWSMAFSIPLLFTFGFLLPCSFWYGVYKNRDHLDYYSVRKTWGYLYNEYRIHAYFWETLKIVQKQIIIIVLAYYDDHVSIKASLVFLVLFAYTFIASKQQPYMTGQLNIIDTQSTVICAVSIILASSIYTAQQQDLIEIQWPFYIIIGLLNGFYIFRMLMQILFAYFNKLQENIDKLKETIQKYFPNLAEYHPFLKIFLETHKNKYERIKKRYGKLREYLIPQARLIIQFKKFKQLELSSKNTTKNSIDKSKQETQQQFSAGICSVDNLVNLNILNNSQIKRNEFSFPNTKIDQKSFAIQFQRDVGRQKVNVERSQLNLEQEDV